MPRAIFFILFLWFASAALALDAPEDLTVRGFLKPEGDRLHLLLRVPFKALNGIEFPSRGAKGELDIGGVEAVLPSAARWWLADTIDMFEDGALLAKPTVAAVHVSLPSDTSFDSYESALAHVTGAGLPPNTQVFRDQAMVDVLLDYPIRSDRSRFAIHSNLARLGTRVATELSFLAAGGSVRRFEYTGDPGTFDLTPRWYAAARHFLSLGFWRAVQSADVLLFLFCTALLFRGLRATLPFAAAFALAFSVTLIASAYHLAADALWFPLFIETMVAACILYMAFVNIVTVWRPKADPPKQWRFAFGAGLVYGFSFAFTLTPALQFAGTHNLLSIVSFSVGLEVGQGFALLVFISALDVLLRFTERKRMEITILAALAADLGWHRFTGRAEQLSQFRLRWPTVDAALLASAMAWLTIFLILAGLAFLVLGVRARAMRRHRSREVPASSSSASARPRPDPSW